jgi:DNA-binding NarL/FixJ family response regulator
MGIDNLFISANGGLLPRWLEAFPDARGGKTGAALQKQKCDIAWLRIAAGDSAPQQLEEVRKHLGGVTCVVLSDLPDDEQALAAFGAAARGYCNTHAAPAVLQQVASVVRQGGLWIGESLMQRVIASTARIMQPPDQAMVRGWADILTGREREIARHIARGASNKEIARELGITERTVKAHVGAILEKLKVRDRLQIALRVNGQSPS